MCSHGAACHAEALAKEGAPCAHGPQGRGYNAAPLLHCSITPWQSCRPKRGMVNGDK
jgi:hypothetical protein